LPTAASPRMPWLSHFRTSLGFTSPNVAHEILSQIARWWWWWWWWDETRWDKMRWTSWKLKRCDYLKSQLASPPLFIFIKMVPKLIRYLMVCQIHLIMKWSRRRGLLQTF
jgi:hypothetical protein